MMMEVPNGHAEQKCHTQSPAAQIHKYRSSPKACCRRPSPAPHTLESKSRLYTTCTSRSPQTKLQPNRTLAHPIRAKIRYGCKRQIRPRMSNGMSSSHSPSEPPLRAARRALKSTALATRWSPIAAFHNGNLLQMPVRLHCSGTRKIANGPSAWHVSVSENERLSKTFLSFASLVF